MGCDGSSGKSESNFKRDVDEEKHIRVGKIVNLHKVWCQPREMFRLEEHCLLNMEKPKERTRTKERKLMAKRQFLGQYKDELFKSRGTS